MRTSMLEQSDCSTSTTTSPPRLQMTRKPTVERLAPFEMDLPGGPLGLIVVHDDVGVIGRAGRGEVELLGGDVAGAEAPLDFCGGSQSRQIPDPGAIQYLLERGGHEDAQVPSVDQLWAQEEHPVKE